MTLLGDRLEERKLGISETEVDRLCGLWAYSVRPLTLEKMIQKISQPVKCNYNPENMKEFEFACPLVCICNKRICMTKATTTPL